MQNYSEEEKLLLEDLKHGIVLGTNEFVKKLRGSFSSGSAQKEIPQSRKIRKDVDLSDLIDKAAEGLNVDLLFCKKSKRIPKETKMNRYLLIFCIWKTGLFSNERIGHQFGVSYSSISHIVKSVQDRLGADKVLMGKFMNIYSLFKI